MSEGRIERAIRKHLIAHPDEAFSTDDLCEVCYPSAPRFGLAGPDVLGRKHRVAVLRAADKVLASDPDWKSASSSGRGNMRFFWNAASIPSTAMGFIMSLGDSGDTRDWLVRQTREELEDPGGRRRCESKVADHIALRDAADPAERERLKAQQEAASAARLAAAMGRPGIRAALNKPQVLSDPQPLPTPAEALSEPFAALAAPQPACRNGLSIVARLHLSANFNAGFAWRGQLWGVADASVFHLRSQTCGPVSAEAGPFPLLSMAFSGWRDGFVRRTVSLALIEHGEEISEVGWS